MLLYKLKWFIIKLNIFKFTFHSIEGFVYVNKYREPVHYISDSVKWLGTVDVHCYYKDMEKKARESFSAMYPQYKGYINIF